MSEENFTLADLTLTKLENKLSSQSGSPSLNLSDAFIGDEGCASIAQYIQNNPQISNLELRGNNITPSGLRTLSLALKQLTALKVLSLEWNNIENGLPILVECLLCSRSIQVLDLRNNKIPAESGASIGKLIEKSSSLQRLDLRWNELAEGSACVLSALQRPHSLQSIELAGNRVPEETLQAIDSLFDNHPEDYAALRRRNSPSYSPSHSPKHSPKHSPSRSPSHSPPKHGDELYEKYESTMMANARHEARINELEAVLEQESKRHQDLRTQLIRELENEKAKRGFAEETFQQLQGEVFQRETQENRARQDLESRISLLQQDKASLSIELDCKHEEVASTSQSLHEQIRALEEKALQQQRQARQQEDSSRQAMERAAREFQHELDGATRSHQQRVESLEEGLSQLQQARGSADQENCALRQQVSQLRASNEEDLASQEYRIRSEETDKFTATMRDFDKRLGEVESNRDTLNRKLQEAHRERALATQEHLEQTSELESNVRYYKEEALELQQHLQHATASNESFRTDLSCCKSALEQLKREKDELSSALQASSIAHKQKLEKLAQDHSFEREEFGGKAQELQRHLEEVQQGLSKLLRERDLVLSEYYSLAETLKLRSTSVLDDTFAAHARSLEHSLAK